MCEPTHSVLQFPRFNEVRDPLDHYITTALSRSLSQHYAIGNFLHYSKAGFGHSEALTHTALAASRLPDPNRYEGNWWNRSFREDGYYGDQADRQEALQASTKYYEKFCARDVPTLTKFLLNCLRNSDRPETYLDLIQNQLFRAGAKAVAIDAINKSLADSKPGNRHKFNGALRTTQPEVFARLLECVTDLLQNRGMYVPEWADDDKIWTPNNEPVAVGEERSIKW